MVVVEITVVQVQLNQLQTTPKEQRNETHTQLNNTRKLNTTCSKYTIKNETGTDLLKKKTKTKRKNKKKIKKKKNKYKIRVAYIHVNTINYE